MSQGNSILTLIIIFLLLSPPLFSFLSCVQSSLPLSYSPLADSLTGFVPLADHSALIMRIISSHHSPRCASSISSGLFAHHQTLPISPFICVCVCLWPDARRTRTRLPCITATQIKCTLLLRIDQVRTYRGVTVQYCPRNRGIDVTSCTGKGERGLYWL